MLVLLKTLLKVARQKSLELQNKMSEILKKASLIIIKLLIRIILTKPN